MKNAARAPVETNSSQVRALSPRIIQVLPETSTPTLERPPVRGQQRYPQSGWRLSPAVGFQRPQQGSGATFQVVNGTGAGKCLGRGDHPEGEVVVRDVQFHGSLKEGCDGWLELSAGEELESRAVGAVVDEDADELSHDRFGVFH